MIAVAVLAYNRLNLLRQCVENVLARTSEATTEIIIWDNASVDGTGDYLRTLTDPRIKVISHPVNIGLNAYALAFPMTTADYLVTLDEDVIDAPQDWDRRLLEAFERLPDVGYLATSQVDDERSLCATIMHHKDRHLYSDHVVNGVQLLEGPVGGWCGMTSRRVHDLVNGFPRHKKEVYFDFDAMYVRSIQEFGYRAAILKDLEVFHASGPAFSPVLPEKHAFYARLFRSQSRKETIKRVIVRVPYARSLNDRFHFFNMPETSTS